MYYALTYCRVLGYLKDRLVLSKREGGEWGVKNLPIGMSSIVACALDAYISEREFSADDNVIKTIYDELMSLRQQSEAL